MSVPFYNYNTLLIDVPYTHQQLLNKYHSFRLYETIRLYAVDVYTAADELSVCISSIPRCSICSRTQ